MTNYESEPVKTWEYRNFKCALYCLRITDDSRWIGYVRIGDKWTDVVDEQGTDPGNDDEIMTEKVENKVDQIVQDVLSDDDSGLDWPIDDPVDPNPGIDPNPMPGPDPDDEPFNPSPTWGNGNYRNLLDHLDIVNVSLDGTASIKTTTGDRTKVGLSDIDADDLTDDGLYKD